MDFRNDVFISFNISPDTDKKQKKWCVNLGYFLNILLTRLMGKNPSIITSEDLAKKNSSSADLEEIISGSAIFVIILTPDYGHSGNTKQELDIICKYGQTKSFSEETIRIFKILKSPLPMSQQPQPLRKIIDMEFFVREGVKSELHDVDNLFAAEIERQYWFKLVDLAYDIFTQLQFLIDKKHKEYFGKTIYLAEVTSDQTDNRDAIKRELQRHGYKILPDKTLPESPLDLRAEVFDYLGRSCLSVHIIGEEYGEALRNSDYSLVDLQNRIAADYFDKVKDIKIDTGNFIFSRIIWISPELKLNDEKQRHFTEQLKRDAEALRGADVLETPIEILKSVIRKKAVSNVIPQKKQDEENKEPRKKARKPKVYLIYERNNEEEIELINKWFENNGFEILKPSYYEDKINLMQLHRDNLLNSDAVVIYFNSTNKDWLKTKLQDLIKAPGYGRLEPFKAKALYLNDLNVVSEQVFDIHEILKIQESGNLENKFKDFVQQLK